MPDHKSLPILNFMSGAVRDSTLTGTIVALKKSIFLSAFDARGPKHHSYRNRRRYYRSDPSAEQTVHGVDHQHQKNRRCVEPFPSAITDSDFLGTCKGRVDLTLKAENSPVQFPHSETEV